MRIKCYDRAGRLYTTSELKKNSNAFYDALFEAHCIIRSECIFIKDRSTGIKLNTKQQKATVQKKYIGSDGKSTWLIPIRPSAYPLQNT